MKHCTNNVMNTTRRQIAAIITISLLLVSPVSAQQNSSELQEALPIEVGLLFYKLRGARPDYETLIRNNFLYQRAVSQAERDQLMQEQKIALQKIYDRMGKGKLIMLKRQITVEGLDTRQHTVKLTPMHPDEPHIFTSLAGDKYGIFLRNASDTRILTQPFMFSTILALKKLIDYNETVFPVEILVNPIAADNKRFPLPSGEEVNVILGDITDIKIYHPKRHKLLMHKRLIERDTPAGWSLSTITSEPVPINPDLPILPPPVEWK